jgi:hypothetical protein
MATQAQIKKIHALKSALNLADSEYRAMLESYISPDGIPLWSSKDLSFDQASSLIRSMEMVIDRAPALKARLYATPKQLQFTRALWSRITLTADEDGARNTLRSFLSRRFHIRRFDRIPRKKMAKVIKSLRIIFDRISLKDTSKSPRV